MAPPEIQYCMYLEQDMSEFFRFIGLTLIGSYGADVNAREGLAHGRI